MKNRILNFLKDKFNITLIVLQVVAWTSYFLASVAGFFVVAFFALEGVFFIVWGVKFLYQNRADKDRQQLLNELPYSEQERVQITKNSVKTAKNNKLIAVILIMLGIVLFFSVFSLF